MRGNLTVTLFIRKLAFVLGVVFGLVSMQSHAAAQFPAEIAACVASTACSPPLVIGASATTAAFSYTQGTEQRYLLSYTLGAASHANGTLLSDHMWVGVSAAYDLATALHPISLYFDRVTPTPPNLWIAGDSDGLDVQVALTSAALLDGSVCPRSARSAITDLPADLGLRGYRS